MKIDYQVFKQPFGQVKHSDKVPSFTCIEDLWDWLYSTRCGVYQAILQVSNEEFNIEGVCEKIAERLEFHPPKHYLDIGINGGTIIRLIFNNEEHFMYCKSIGWEEIKYNEKLKEEKEEKNMSVTTNEMIKKLNSGEWEKATNVNFKIKSKYIESLYPYSYSLCQDDKYETRTISTFNAETLNTLGMKDGWVEYIPPILDYEEKRYLKNLVRPFRDRVKFISKFVDIDCDDEEGYFEEEYIAIYLKDSTYPIYLPTFEKDTMYKGMKLSCTYTLKDLDLFKGEE